MYSAQAIYGLPLPAGTSAAAAPTEHMASHQALKGGFGQLVDPENPLMWFGLFLLVTVGAVGVAGSARVGKVKVAAEAGRT